MGEKLLGHQVVRLDGRIDVFAVDTDGDTHQHVLRTFDNFSIDLQQVAPLQRLEAEVLQSKRGILSLNNYLLKKQNDLKTKCLWYSFVKFNNASAI